MNAEGIQFGTRDVLLAARKVADFATLEGISVKERSARGSYGHLGAVLADSVLQAGLNYASVVRPRVHRILKDYPEAATIDPLISIVRAGETNQFLNWTHDIKESRFNELVKKIHQFGVKDVYDLRDLLQEEVACIELQTLKGIGPKTVDYMSCLVGIESIAVDRHIRTYAKRAGVQGSEYYYLKKIFCFAADLLSVSRREFDAWVWRRESGQRNRQLSFIL